MGEMKKSIWILCLAIAITGILSFENSAIAVLNVSGNVAQDSNTGFEWLVMSQTVNKSPDRIMAGDYGLKGAGWALATISQINTLFLNAGIKEPFNGTSSPWNYDAINHLIALLEYTYEVNSEFGDNFGIQAFCAATGTSPGRLYTPNILVGSTPTGNVGGANISGASVPSSVASPTIGNWLVRANPAISPPAFGSNSATLTNNYVPLKVGDKLIKLMDIPF